MAKNHEMAALSPPLMLVAFVKIWSDEREIVVLCCGERGGKMAGKKKGREGKLWLEARHRIIIPLRLSLPFTSDGFYALFR